MNQDYFQGIKMNGELERAIHLEKEAIKAASSFIFVHTSWSGMLSAHRFMYREEMARLILGIDAVSILSKPWLHTPEFDRKWNEQFICEE